MTFEIFGICIGYTMEKCGICAYVTHGFAVFLEAKPSEKTGKRVGYIIDKRVKGLETRDDVISRRINKLVQNL